MFNEQQIKWLKRVEELFLRYGIKSLNMDDIARELGISKKTLYQFVDSKDDLVVKVMELHIEEDCRVADELRARASDALDEIFQIVQYNAVDMGRMKTNVIFELRRYHPEAWDRIQHYNWHQLYKVVLENLQWGIRDGLYRTDFESETVARLHIATVLNIFDEHIFPRPPFALEKLFHEYILFYLHGILSEKGREKLREKINNGANPFNRV